MPDSPALPPALSETRAAIEKLPRSEPVVKGGCECRGTWADMEVASDGEWVYLADVLALLPPQP